MKRKLIENGLFLRSTKRLVKKNKQLAIDIRNALLILSEDAFDPRLKTHKLKGKLESSWLVAQVMI